MSQTFANIQAEEFSIGLGTIIEPTAVIRGLQGKAKKIHLGDHCYIGHHVQIICDDFSLGDYSKIQHNTNIHGYLPCHIGHNLWMGQYSIVDSLVCILNHHDISETLNVLPKPIPEPIPTSKSPESRPA